MQAKEVQSSYVKFDEQFLEDSPLLGFSGALCYISWPSSADDQIASTDEGVKAKKNQINTLCKDFFVKLPFPVPRMNFQSYIFVT